MGRGHRQLLCWLALAAGLNVAGCGGRDDDEPTSDTAPVAPQTAAVSFQADAGTQSEEVLDLGGLTLRGYCIRRNGQVHLTVTATTSADNAVLGSRASQAGNTSPFTVVLDDFDASFGEYDLLGKASDEIAGTLNYLNPDGGQVAVDWTAAEDTPDAECAFGGVATYAP